MSKRGFALLDPERRRAISSMGGKAAHASGTAHRFTTEEAEIAGRKGGQARGKAARARQPSLPFCETTTEWDPLREEDDGPPTLRAPSVGSAA